MTSPYTPWFFGKFPDHYIPPSAEEYETGDFIDPAEKLEPKCLAECSSWLNEYQACVSRVDARTDGKGNCRGQYEELVMCKDHCLEKKLFYYLK